MTTAIMAAKSSGYACILGDAVGVSDRCRRQRHDYVHADGLAPLRRRTMME